MNEESKTPENEEQSEAVAPETEAGTPDEAPVPEAEDVAADIAESGDEQAVEAEAVAETSEEAQMEQAVAEMVEAAVAAPAAESAAEEGDAGETPGEEPAEPQDEAPEESEAETDTVAEESAEAADVEERPAADEDAGGSEDDDEPQAAPEAETPDYDYDTLHGMNVHQLQEVAQAVDHEAVHGFTTMHKEELLHALCEAFGIEEHVHHEVVGIDKVAIKAKIKALKLERDEAQAAGDRKRLKMVRRRIHLLKHRIRKATV